MLLYVRKYYNLINRTNALRGRKKEKFYKISYYFSKY